MQSGSNEILLYAVSDSPGDLALQKLLWAPQTQLTVSETLGGLLGTPALLPEAPQCGLTQVPNEVLVPSQVICFSSIAKVKKIKKKKNGMVMQLHVLLFYRYPCLL